ncbi:hypothetical protein Hanom_Chr02g00131621 [Helianthus anomalus]
MSTRELSDVFQNISVNNTDVDTTKYQTGIPTGYEADRDEPMVFQAQPLPKAPPKKRKRILDWKVKRKKKVPRATKIKRTGETSGKTIVGESSNTTTMTLSWEELDQRLANYKMFRPIPE